MDRPRLLLVPFMTELEWAIRPQLEEWADVASFDAPGVGDEPPAETFGRDAIARRGLAEIDRRGWERCVVVADGFGGRSAVRLAEARPAAIAALALGHARLSNATDGERAPVNRAVVEAFAQLVRNDFRAFIRHGLTQVTHGSYGDQLAERMLERVPSDVAMAAWDMASNEPEPFGEVLAALGVPLLLGRHEGCLVTTKEGVEDALAAFPEARSVSVPDAPAVSPEFAEALRSFCAELDDKERRSDEG
jgi:pimeloyl-ACP methyl ester carboxylesterase